MWMQESKVYWGQVIPNGNFEAYGHYSKYHSQSFAPYSYSDIFFQLKACGGVQAELAWPVPDHAAGASTPSADTGVLEILLVKGLTRCLGHGVNCATPRRPRRVK